MISSVTDKFRSYIFPSYSEKASESPSRKRKRPLETEDSLEADGDSDIEIVAVKRAKQNSVFDIFSSPVNKMAHWFRQKTSFSRDFFFKPVDDQSTKLNVPPDISYKKGCSILPKSNGKNWTSETLTSEKTAPLSQPNMFQSQKIKRSYRDVIISNTPPMQTNGHADGCQQVSKKQSISRDSTFFKLSSSPSAQPTAQLCVRLDEKEKYRQLLQQFIATPLDSSRHKKKTPLKSNFFSKRQTSSNFDESSKNKSNTSERRKQCGYRPIIKGTDPLTVSSTYLLKHHKPAVDLLASAPSLPIIDTSRIIESPPSPEQNEETERISSHSHTSDKSFLDVSSTFEKIDQSLYIRDDWIKEIKENKELDKEERNKKIAIAEVTVKAHHEWRRKHDKDLEKNLQDQMRALEPFTEKVQYEDKDIPELPEISDEMNDTIERALTGGSIREVIADGFKLQITREDILTLDGLNWLNDEVINFYMNLLMERGQQDNMAKVHAFNTFFYPKLISAGHSALRRWTKRVDVLAVDYILVPVHLGMHWCLAIVDFKKKCVEYYDSMGGKNDKCLKALKQYLCDESLDKKKQQFDLSGWESTNIKDIPQQMNGSDCGMFTCKYAEYVTRGAKITFSQEDMPYFRRRMVYEIVTKKLLQ